MTKDGIRESYLRTMIRYPKTMARLGGYSLTSIRKLYDSYATPVTDDEKELLARLK